MAKRGASRSSTGNNAALESCKTSSEILREARAAIRLADSTERPYSSLDINRAAPGSDYSEKNSVQSDKATNKKSHGVDVYPASGLDHSFQRLSNLQPIVVPAALFQRQPPSKPKSYNKSNGTTSESPPLGNYGYAPSPTDARVLTTRSGVEPRNANEEEGSTNNARRDSLEKDNPREELMGVLATIRTDTRGNENDDNLSILRDAVLRRKEILKHGPLRSEIMKEMFRLMNESEPDTTVQIVNIILRLKPSGKNLTTIFKVLYRLSENDDNDHFLYEKDFLTRFLSTLRELQSSKYPRAVLYAYGMLKNLSLNENFVKMMSETDNLAPAAISKHLSGLTRQMRRKIGKHEAAYASFLHLLDFSKALTSVPEVCLKVYANDANLISEFCGSMAVCVHDLDVTLKIVQILRRAARYEECCEHLARCAFCFPVCVQIVKKYFGHQFLVKGVCYVLGSVVATRKNASSRLYETPQALDVLLALLHHYVSNERNAGRGNENYGKTNSFEGNENNSVIYKVLRVLANASCSEEVGQSLAKHTLCVDLLSDILNPKIETLEKRVFLATLTTLSNLAYYLGNSLGPSAVLLAEKLLSLLENSDDPEVLVEIYHNLCNLTRNEQVRVLLIKRKIIAGLLDNLEEDYLAAVYYSSAILLNLLVEREARLQFHANGGIPGVVAALRDLVPDEWTVATLLCQLIWNFARSQIGQTVNVITGEEARLLIQGLEELIDENYVFPDKDPRDDEEKQVRKNWEEYFCPLATELLDFLTGGVATL